MGVPNCQIYQFFTRKENLYFYVKSPNFTFWHLNVNIKNSEDQQNMSSGQMLCGTLTCKFCCKLTDLEET